MRAFACGFGGPEPGPPPGSSFEHAVCADWNAGEAGLIPELGVIWMPPPEPGSGKSDTPCERMHLENASCELPLLAVGLPEDPHAATSSPQLRMIAIRLATPPCVAQSV